MKTAILILMSIVGFLLVVEPANAVVTINPAVVQDTNNGNIVLNSVKFLGEDLHLPGKGPCTGMKEIWLVARTPLGVSFESNKQNRILSENTFNVISNITWSTLPIVTQQLEIRTDEPNSDYCAFTEIASNFDGDNIVFTLIAPPDVEPTSTLVYANEAVNGLFDGLSDLLMLCAYVFGGLLSITLVFWAWGWIMRQFI